MRHSLNWYFGEDSHFFHNGHYKHLDRTSIEIAKNIFVKKESCSLDSDAIAEAHKNYCSLQLIYRKKLVVNRLNGIYHDLNGPAIVYEDNASAWYVDGVLHREDGPALVFYVGVERNEFWYKHGVLHCENGPAVVKGKDYFEYWVSGVLHRENGPAIVSKFGNQWFYYGKRLFEKKMGSVVRKCNGRHEWLLDGILHREDGPAIVCENGTQMWYIKGRLHREDGPAAIYAEGTKAWYLDGQLHRKDGPAIVCSDGHQEWYLNGKEVKKEDVLKSGSLICLAKSDKKIEVLEHPDRTEFKLDGKLHREDGPAIVRQDGSEEYWLNGEKVKKEDLK